MRRCWIRLTAATAAFAMALPAAGAAANDQTDVTVEVTGDTGLSIAVPQGGVTLTDQGGIAGGALPQTTVTDARGLLGALTWNVTVSGTDLAHTTLDAVIARSEVHVHLPVLGVDSFDNMEAVAWELPAGLNRLDANAGTGHSLVDGTSLLGTLGTGTVVYTPQISVEVPEGQLGGTYTGSVMQTVS